MIVIDGATGEGGGQILRTSLALSMVTGNPFRIENIRANRKKPGLMRQHLTAVAAAQRVSNAYVVGAEIGSRSVTFEPGPVVGGNYAFSVGTAGSATLVFETVLPALLLAGTASHLTFEGGTHNPYAPPFEFIDRAFCPLLHRMAAAVALRLYRPGFYPAGGGKFAVDITPAEKLVPIEIADRGKLRTARAEAVVANLPIHIAEREVGIVGERLGWPRDELHAREEERAQGPGNVLLLTLRFDHVTEVFTGFGQLGVSAESVAERAVESARKYLSSNAAIGHHLADQLVLPMALAGAGQFRTVRPSRYLLTNAEVIEKFIDTRIEIQKVDSRRWHVTIGG